MNKKGRLYVGVDIGKNRLDVAAPGLRFCVENNLRGWKIVLRKTGRLHRHINFVCEPIGHYGGAFIRFLHAQRKIVSVVSGLRARNFALATGRLAKTDRIDAEMLAELGRTLRPRVTPRPDKQIEYLREVMRCNRYLTRSQAAEERYAVCIRDPHTQQALEPVLDAMKAQRKTLDKLSTTIVAADPMLRAKHKAFCEVNGVADSTAKFLLAEIPELGKLNRREAASLAGLAPYNKDSGLSQPSRHIQGGREKARTALYMAAFAASRLNPILKPFYTRLRARGKPYRVALTAVMRKLLIHLNSVAAKVEAELGKHSPAVREKAGKKSAVSKRVLIVCGQSKERHSARSHLAAAD